MRTRLGILPALLLVSLCCRYGQGQLQRPLCEDGDGRFQTHFDTGATVTVSALQNGKFSERKCTAKIHWSRRNLTVVPAAAQIDVDVLGADLGFRDPVAAFVIRTADKDRQAVYAIYSLRKPVHLLRKLTGSDFYRAVDADLDGRIAIWTRDTAALSGFDDLRYSDFDFPPTVVFRFIHGKLVDVSSEYAAHYDRQIAHVRKQLTPEALNVFRETDGKLLDGSLPSPVLKALRETKVKVLEIVSAWLYSGREQKARTELAADWPPADVDRVWEALRKARRNGLDTQADSVAAPEHVHLRRYAKIYEPPSSPEAAVQSTGSGQFDQSIMVEEEPIDTDFPKVQDGIADVAPRPISLRRTKMRFKRETVELVIDTAGKVWSAKMLDSAQDPELLKSAMGWTFIPAFRKGRAVACQDRLDTFVYK